MKEQDLEKVLKFVKIKTNCNVSIKAVDAFLERAEEKDSGGVDGFDAGYNAHIALHSDGSGSPVELSGCYVGVEVGMAVRRILIDQIADVDSELKSLGLEIA